MFSSLVVLGALVVLEKEEPESEEMKMSWACKPPLQGTKLLQIELFELESKAGCCIYKYLTVCCKKKRKKKEKKKARRPILWYELKSNKLHCCRMRKFSISSLLLNQTMFGEFIWLTSSNQTMRNLLVNRVQTLSLWNNILWNLRIGIVACQFV